MYFIIGQKSNALTFAKRILHDLVFFRNRRYRNILNVAIVYGLSSFFTYLYLHIVVLESRIGENDGRFTSLEAQIFFGNRENTYGCRAGALQRKMVFYSRGGISVEVFVLIEWIATSNIKCCFLREYITRPTTIRISHDKKLFLISLGKISRPYFSKRIKTSLSSVCNEKICHLIVQWYRLKICLSWRTSTQCIFLYNFFESILSEDLIFFRMHRHSFEFQCWGNNVVRKINFLCMSITPIESLSGRYAE